jgi:hypothetical protein
VAAHYGVDPQTFRNRRDKSISRDVAAWLCCQLTSCKLRGLAAEFGLGHADSVRNLTRRVYRAVRRMSAICPERMNRSGWERVSVNIQQDAQAGPGVGPVHVAQDSDQQSADCGVTRHGLSQTFGCARRSGDFTLVRLERLL